MTTEAQGTPHVDDDLLRVAEAVHAGEVSVAFEPGPAVLAKSGGLFLSLPA
jgi:hypothetical protein